MNNNSENTSSLLLTSLIFTDEMFTAPKYHYEIEVLHFSPKKTNKTTLCLVAMPNNLIRVFLGQPDLVWKRHARSRPLGDLK